MPQLTWQLLSYGSFLHLWTLSASGPTCSWHQSGKLSWHGGGGGDGIGGGGRDDVALVVVTHARKIATSLPQKGGRDRVCKLCAPSGCQHLLRWLVLACAHWLVWRYSLWRAVWAWTGQVAGEVLASETRATHMLP